MGRFKGKHDLLPVDAIWTNDTVLSSIGESGYHLLKCLQLFDKKIPSRGREPSAGLVQEPNQSVYFTSISNCYWILGTQ